MKLNHQRLKSQQYLNKRLEQEHWQQQQRETQKKHGLFCLRKQQVGAHTAKTHSMLLQSMQFNESNYHGGTSFGTYAQHV